MAEQTDDRMSFAEAVQFVQQQPGRAAFAAMPVFGDNREAAEGARVFILEADGKGAFHVRFVAGPFFSSAFAANETLAADDIPERVTMLRFTATRLEEEWLGAQVQVLIQKLTQAAGNATTQMPDYAAAPVAAAAPETVFPVSFIGRG